MQLARENLNSSQPRMDKKFEMKEERKRRWRVLLETSDYHSKDQPPLIQTKSPQMKKRTVRGSWRSHTVTESVMPFDLKSLSRLSSNDSMKGNIRYVLDLYQMHDSKLKGHLKPTASSIMSWNKPCKIVFWNKTEGVELKPRLWKRTKRTNQIVKLIK